MAKFYFKILTCILITYGASEENTDQRNEPQEETNVTFSDGAFKEQDYEIDDLYDKNVMVTLSFG